MWKHIYAFTDTMQGANEISSNCWTARLWQEMYSVLTHSEQSRKRTLTTNYEWTIFATLKKINHNNWKLQKTKLSEKNSKFWTKQKWDNMHSAIWANASNNCGVNNYYSHQFLMYAKYYRGKDYIKTNDYLCFYPVLLKRIIVEQEDEHKFIFELVIFAWYLVSCMWQEIIRHRL